MLAFWITVALWAVPSYFLHQALHELAHYRVARDYGLDVTELRLLPGRLQDGRFAFSYIRVPELGQMPPQVKREFFLAPLEVEFDWWMLATLGLMLGNFSLGVGSAFALVEAVAALVDSLVWLLGWWTDKALTDAWVVRKLNSWSLRRARLLSLLWLLPAALTVGSILRVLL